MYNGKELDEDFGLNWYHYGFRIYDPSIGRFPSADPIADEFAHVSPYNYAENYPTGAIDLWGLQKYIPTNLRTETQGNPDLAKNIAKKEKENWDGASVVAATALILAVPGPEDLLLAGWMVKALGISKKTFDIGKIAFSGKTLKGLGISKDAIKITHGTSNQVTIIGEGMKRVTGLGGKLGEAGAKNINIFKPSEEAVKQWNRLTEGGKHLGNDAVKGTKMFKENQKWVQEAKNSGSTIIDIGSDGRKNASTFYKMEKQTIYK